MQEEVENRTVNLAISTTKLTGRTIIAGIRKYLQHREKVKMKKARDPAVHGKQSVKQLLGQNQGATNVEIDKESIRDFEKLAKKYGVDFAVRKDKSVDQSSRLIPRVMVRTSRFSCSIILLVSFTSNILIIAFVFLSMDISPTGDIFVK